MDQSTLEALVVILPILVAVLYLLLEPLGLKKRAEETIIKMEAEKMMDRKSRLGWRIVHGTNDDRREDWRLRDC